MATYLVTYVLNKEVKRPPMLKSIQEDFDGYAKLSESSYAVSTTFTVDGVYAHLKKHIDSNDRLYIITLKKPWQGFGLKAVNEWLDKNLPD